MIKGKIQLNGSTFEESNDRSTNRKFDDSLKWKGDVISHIWKTPGRQFSTHHGVKATANFFLKNLVDHNTKSIVVGSNVSIFMGLQSK